MKRLTRATVLAAALLAGGAGLAADRAGPEAPPTARLMSGSQYANTIESVFGRDVVPAVRFPQFRRTDGLAALGGASTGLTTGVVDTFEGAARAVAAKVVDPAHRQFLITCTPASAAAPDDACARSVLSYYGQLLVRRPLNGQELAGLVSIAHEGAERTGDFYFGLSTSLASLLVMPDFMFFIEATEPDPARRGAIRLTGASKASRLSLMLWNAAPDPELLDAAARGELHTRKGLARQVDRMIASPRFVTGVRAFFSDMLVFEAFDALAKDSEIYPAFTQRVVAAAREQTLRTVVAHLVEQRGDYRDLFRTRRTYLNGGLSPLYQISVDQPNDWVPYELKAGDHRAGLLTQIGFLSVYAHPGRSSPTRRGKAVREMFLCQKVPEPPPNVDFSGFEDPKGIAKTARDRLAAHSTNPVCAGCHKITDPIGLALENFDGAGQFRAQENGVDIDARGALNGVEFADAAGLGEALANDPSLTKCLANRLYAYGTGSPTKDRAWQDQLHAAFAEKDYKFVDLARHIVLTDAFFAVAKPGPAK